MRKVIFFLFISLTNSLSYSQDTAKTILEKVTNLENQISAFVEKNNADVFKFGLSIAVRTLLNSVEEKKARAFAAITPSDKEIAIEYFDRLAVVISTSISVFPFKDGGKFKRFGFTANINLAEFADNKSNTLFNKQIDGGLGFAYYLDELKKFAVAATYERVSVRRPTDFVLQNKGKQILDENGNPYSSLDLKDDRFFINSGVNGLSIKFIFHFDK